MTQLAPSLCPILGSEGPIQQVPPPHIHHPKGLLPYLLVACAVSAKVLVIAAPPRLVYSKVTFTPPLPMRLTDAMRVTPTWMEDTMKVGRLSGDSGSELTVSYVFAREH